MGRHARGASRSRARVAAVVLVGLVIAVIVVGSWVGSRWDSAGSADTVDASAVVVSSLGCSAGSGQTVVDVLPPASSGAMVRATLDACGYREGQQLAVQYRSGDPTGVTLADPGGRSTAPGALLPLGLAVAGLLAVGAALAVYSDGRGGPLRHRHAAGGESPEVPVEGEQDPATSTAAEDEWADSPSDREPGGAAAPAGAAGQSAVLAGDGGRHAAASPDPAAATTLGWGFVPTDPWSTQFPDSNGHGPFTAAQARAIATSAIADEPLLAGPASAGEPGSGQSIDFPWGEDADTRRGEMSSVDLIFPYSSTLAASLHDELYTHRSVSG